MLFFKKKTPYEKELAALLKKERRFLELRKNKKESFINQKLEKFVPKKLQGTLDSAFAKAFGLIFEKGTKYIEKTYDRKSLEIDFYENDYRNGVLESKKTLRAFSKKSKSRREQKPSLFRCRRNRNGNPRGRNSGYSGFHRPAFKKRL